MIHYHVWFTLRPGVDEAAGLAAAAAFQAELSAAGRVARCTLTRNTAEPGKSLLPRYHALFEFADDAQMDATFAAQRTAGIHSGAHGELLRLVAEFKVEVFRSV